MDLEGRNAENPRIIPIPVIIHLNNTTTDGLIKRLYESIGFSTVLCTHNNNTLGSTNKFTLTPHLSKDKTAQALFQMFNHTISPSKKVVDWIM